MEITKMRDKVLSLMEDRLSKAIAGARSNTATIDDIDLGIQAAINLRHMRKAELLCRMRRSLGPVRGAAAGNELCVHCLVASESGGFEIKRASTLFRDCLNAANDPFNYARWMLTEPEVALFFRANGGWRIFLPDGSIWPELFLLVRAGNDEERLAMEPFGIHDWLCMPEADAALFEYNEALGVFSARNDLSGEEAERLEILNDIRLGEIRPVVEAIEARWRDMKAGVVRGMAENILSKLERGRIYEGRLLLDALLLSYPDEAPVMAETLKACSLLHVESLIAFAEAFAEGAFFWLWRYNTENRLAANTYIERTGAIITPLYVRAHPDVCTEVSLRERLVDAGILMAEWPGDPVGFDWFLHSANELNDRSKIQEALKAAPVGYFRMGESMLPLSAARKADFFEGN